MHIHISFSLKYDKIYNDPYFVLLHLMLRMMLRHLKILNNMATYIIRLVKYDFLDFT
jgi:hypothetical protein